MAANGKQKCLTLSTRLTSALASIRYIASDGKPSVRAAMRAVRPSYFSMGKRQVRKNAVKSRHNDDVVVS